MFAVVAVASGARTPPYTWEWPGWSWPGWTAVGSLAQTAVVLATVVSLWIIIRQLLMMKSEADVRARERLQDFERKVTPLLSIEVMARVHPSAHVIVPLSVHADGEGVAYQVITSLQEDIGDQWVELDHGVVRSIRAGEARELQLTWRHTGPTAERVARLNVTFTNHLGHLTRFQQAGFVSDNGLRLTAAPVYEEGVWATPDG